MSRTHNGNPALVVSVPGPRRKRVLALLRDSGPQSAKTLAAIFGAELEIMRTEIGVLKKQGNVRVVRCEQCGSHALVAFVRMTRPRGAKTFTRTGRPWGERTRP